MKEHLDYQRFRSLSSWKIDLLTMYATDSRALAFSDPVEYPKVARLILHWADKACLYHGPKVTTDPHDFWSDTSEDYEPEFSIYRSPSEIIKAIITNPEWQDDVASLRKAIIPSAKLEPKLI